MTDCWLAMTATVIVFVSDSHEEAAIGLGTKEEKLINPT